MAHCGFDDDGGGCFATAVSVEACRTSADPWVADAEATAEMRQAVIGAAAMHGARLALPSAAALALASRQAATMATASIVTRPGFTAGAFPAREADAGASVTATVATTASLAATGLTTRACPPSLAYALAVVAGAMRAAASGAAVMLLARQARVARVAVAHPIAANAVRAARHASIS